MLWLNPVSMKKIGSSILHGSSSLLYIWERHNLSLGRGRWTEHSPGTDRDSECHHRQHHGCEVSPCTGPFIYIHDCGQGMPSPAGATGLWDPMPPVDGLILRAPQLTSTSSPMKPCPESKFTFCRTILNLNKIISHKALDNIDARNLHDVWSQNSFSALMNTKKPKTNLWSEAQGCLLSASLCLFL